MIGFKFNPGDMFVRICPTEVEMLIICLSSDKTYGWQGQDYVWRCSEFQKCKDGGLFGAQIVLYTEDELESFGKIDSIYDRSSSKFQ